MPKNGHFSPISGVFSPILAGKFPGEGRPLFGGSPGRGVPGGVRGKVGQSLPWEGTRRATGGVGGWPKNSQRIFYNKIFSKDNFIALKIVMSYVFNRFDP
jgi:hypothetical protein